MRSLRCLLGRHKWQTRYNDDQERYVVCVRCHRQGPKPTAETNNPDINPPGLAGFGGSGM